MHNLVIWWAVCDAVDGVTSEHNVLQGLSFTDVNQIIVALPTNAETSGNYVQYIQSELCARCCHLSGIWGRDFST